MHNERKLIRKPYDDRIEFRIDSETKTKLIELATRDRRTLSSYLQKLLWEHIAAEAAPSETNNNEPPGPT